MPKYHNLNKLLYTAEEAAEVLSIGRTRVFALMASGDLPSVKVGKSRRITAESLEQYVARLAAA